MDNDEALANALKQMYSSKSPQGSLEIEKIFPNVHRKKTVVEICRSLSKRRGLYAFQCLITKGLYIGSSQNLWKRFYQHSLGHRSNIILQHAINKYGLINFIFVVFKSVAAKSNLLDKKELEKSESALVAGFDKKLLYNINNNTARRRGIMHTTEAKLRMRELRLQRGHPLERVVYVYDKALNFVAKFDSL